MSHPISKASSAAHGIGTPDIHTSAGRGPQRGPKRQRAGAAQADGPSFGEVLSKTAKDISNGERMISEALRKSRHGSLSNEQLLTMQAGIYRYTREVELAGKLVERSTSGLRQLLQSQQ